MSRKPASETPRKPPASRDDRLKSALKANMARRKAQARARDGMAKTNEEK